MVAIKTTCPVDASALSLKAKEDNTGRDVDRGDCSLCDYYAEAVA